MLPTSFDGCEFIKTPYKAIISIFLKKKCSKTMKIDATFFTETTRKDPENKPSP